MYPYCMLLHVLIAAVSRLKCLISMYLHPFLTYLLITVGTQLIPQRPRVHKCWASSEYERCDRLTDIACDVYLHINMYIIYIVKTCCIINRCFSNPIDYQLYIGMAVEPATCLYIYIYVCIYIYIYNITLPS